MSSLLISDIFKNVQFTFGNVAIMATAAVTLARGGAKVAVVEAGPWRDPADYPSTVYGASLSVSA